MGHLLGAPALADGIDLLLRRGENFPGVAHPLLNHGRNVPGGLGHGAQQGLVPDDARILQHIGRGRGHLHKLQEVGPGILPVYPGFFHLPGHRHTVDGLGVDEHGINGLEDLPILPQVKILGLEPVHHILDAVRVNEHGPQHRLLRLRGMGHGTAQQLVHRHRGNLLPSCFSYFSSVTITYTVPLISKPSFAFT